MVGFGECTVSVGHDSATSTRFSSRHPPHLASRTISPPSAGRRRSSLLSLPVRSEFHPSIVLVACPVCHEWTRVHPCHWSQVENNRPDPDARQPSWQASASSSDTVTHPDSIQTIVHVLSGQFASAFFCPITDGVVEPQCILSIACGILRWKFRFRCAPPPLLDRYEPRQLELACQPDSGALRMKRSSGCGTDALCF